MFVLKVQDRSVIRQPGRGLKESACTPLFFNAFNIRGALSCIHTHSQHCGASCSTCIRIALTPYTVMATLLWGKEFRSKFCIETYSNMLTKNAVSHQEMIKGVRKAGMSEALTYLDTLVIPIIENTPNEEDLMEGMAEVSVSA